MTAGEWLAVYQDQVRDGTRARYLVAFDFPTPVRSKPRCVAVDNSTFPGAPPSVMSMVTPRYERVDSGNRRTCRAVKSENCVLITAKPYMTQLTRHHASLRKPNINILVESFPSIDTLPRPRGVTGCCLFSFVQVSVFDAIVTVFFLDTAPVVVEYIGAISR